ncbi:MAG: homocysteine methyltransferase, partial [Ruminococcaceae bacterium]|nr:homocysteine methyltransferase [Oscillospiraceae bacterium]
MSIRKLLQTKRLYFDGGTGTLLQARGLRPGELPETWNLSHPDVITELHLSYLEAGANILCANTFGAYRHKFGDEILRLIPAAIANAKAAVARCSDPRDRFVALDLGPCGQLLEPLGSLGFEDAVRLFAESVRIGAEAGADLILIETMNDAYETKAAVLAAKENSDLPVFVTCAYDESGKLMTGADPRAMVALLEGLRVDALGINCSVGPLQMKDTVAELLRYASVPVIVNPNAGLPRTENGKTVFDVTPETFADHMAELAHMGACVLGGCCGTTPEHIALTVSRTATIPYAYPEKKHDTLVSSYTHAVSIGDAPVIIGERINPTGKKRFKEALRTGDVGYILGEGLAEEEAGAHILDVNVGLPDIDEEQMLTRVVKELQAVTALPLQIDTVSPAAMAHALRIYNGKPLINSVNGTEESMNAILPLAA